MSDLLNVSTNPHVRSKATTSNIMLDVLIALLPATIFGIYIFKLHALLLVLVTVATCVAAEGIYEHFMGKKSTIKDLSAVVTGVLLALNLPPEAPIWIGIIGGIFAIIIVKQLFGGLGQNFMNPALGARCFLLISFTGRMTTFTYDAVTTATPLAAVKAGEWASLNVVDMFIGKIPGTIGETSAIALIIGGVYLIVKKVISWKIPVTYIATFSIFVLIFGQFNMTYLAAHLFGGGLMLGAFFMATDYVTSPITANGKIMFGIILGIFTGLFRLFGGSAEGVSYAIILSNLLVPLIEKVTQPTAFGRGGKKHE